MNKHQTFKSFFTSVILVINLFYSVNAYTQMGNPIIDAPKLKNFIDKLVVNPDSAALAQEVLDVINANSSKQFDNYAEMRQFINSNKNVFGIIDSLLARVPKPRFKPDTINASTDEFLSSNATFHVSNPLGLPAIDALGTFIAERFKQELEIAFLQKFKEWLEDNSKVSHGLRVLLPETKNVLMQNEPYQYTVFLETLKESFRKDLNNIPINIGAYLGSDPFKLGEKTPHYFTSLLIYNNIVQIIYGQSIIETLKNLSQDSLLPRSPENIQSVVHFLSLTSQLLNNPERPEEWLDVSKIKTSLKEVIHIKLFIELLLLKYDPQLNKIMLSPTVSLYQAIVSNKKKVNIVLDWLKELAASYTMIKKYYETITNALNTSQDFPGDAIIGLENSLIASFKTFFTVKNWGVIIDPSIESTFNLVLVKVRSFTELVVNIKEKNYGLALTKAIDMLLTFVNDPKAIDLIRKYGNFAVSVAKAENKTDMLAALRTAALPVGSYRIKRNSFSNISLNAYAGLGVGYQKFSSDVPAGIEKTNTILGFTAPVGLAYSWGYRKIKTRDSVNGSSGTIFLSILDIGAVTAFRLTKDSTETLPELKWSNLLAPGAYYVHGFKRSPISAGFGIQYGPQVRSIKNNSAVELPAAWSARLFLAVDIPIFNFYSRTELKEKQNKKKSKS